MTVKDAIAKMQMMIDMKLITGEEPFGVFRSNYLEDVYFEEAEVIHIECDWEDKGNVVYIE